MQGEYCRHHFSRITTLSVKVLSWRHSDRVRGRVRDRRVRLPAEVESPRPGEPPGLQRRVERQAEELRHAGPRLDGPAQHAVTQTCSYCAKL